MASEVKVERFVSPAVQLHTPQRSVRTCLGCFFAFLITALFGLQPFFMGPYANAPMVPMCSY